MSEETAAHESWLRLRRAAVEAKADYMTNRNCADPNATRILRNRWQDAAYEDLLGEIVYWQVRDGE